MASSTDVWRNLATAITNSLSLIIYDCMKQDEFSLLPTQHKKNA